LLATASASRPSPAYGERLAPVAGLEHLEAVLPEAELDHLPHPRLVVHHQDASAFHRRTSVLLVSRRR